MFQLGHWDRDLLTPWIPELPVLALLPLDLEQNVLLDDLEQYKVVSLQVRMRRHRG